MADSQMEAAAESESPKATCHKHDKEPNINNQSRVLSAPRTRSQVAPEWTTKEALILVNEITAVEKDCLKALSSHQRWKMIVENCVALDVVRTMNQCKSKWNSLTSEYNKIKKWDKESESRDDLYWSLECQRRKEFGLPENFDDELFKAIDDYIWSQKGQPDSDPETDAGSQADLLDVVAKFGSKKQKRQSTSMKTLMEGKTPKCSRKENAQKTIAGERPQERCAAENPQAYFITEMPKIISAEKESQETQVEEKLQTTDVEEEPQETSLMKEHLQTVHVEEKTCERHAEENYRTCYAKEKPWTIPVKMELQGNLVEVELKENFVKEKPEKHLSEEKLPQNVNGDEKSKIYQNRKKSIPSKEEREQMMVEKLHKNAELIQAVVNRNLPETTDPGAGDSNNMEGFKTDFIRSQGDKIIECLQNIVNTINQYPWLVQERD